MKIVTATVLLSISYFGSLAQEWTGIIESNNRFAFNFYQKLNEADKNFVFSPASITSAMAMTYIGAKNNTFEEIRNTFYFNDDLIEFSKDYIHLLEFDESYKGDLRFFNANSLWVQKGLSIKQNFLDINKEYFLSSLNYTDYIRTPEKSRLEINKWVEEKTNKKITNLLLPSTIDKSTRLVLVNAMYFKSPWRDKFNKENNIEANFQIDKTKFVNTIFMNRFINTGYYSDKCVQIIDIPYADSDFSLMIILPKSYNDFEKLEKELNYDYYINYILKNEIKRVDLFLPKFNIESEFDLNKALYKMGIHDAFTGKADFSGITDAEKLFISKVVHKANISINEEGTEAAAATAVIMSKTAMFIEEVEFNVNKPFIYILRNTENDCIYFIGKIINPNE